MRIVLLHFHFKIPREGGALRSYFIANGLQARGIDMEVITTHSSRHYEKIESEGITIHKLPVKYSNHFGFLRRILAFLRFNRLAGKLLKSLPTPNLLYCISTPLTTGLAAIKFKKTTSVPFVFEVGDLWPEAPIQMGVIRAPYLKNWLYSMEKRIYLEAEKMITLSPPISQYVAKIIDENKIIEIPNMADGQFFTPTIKSGRSDELMPGYKFLIGCIGAIGKANHLDYLIAAARHFLDEQSDVGFIIMGAGSEEERINKSSEGMPNLKILPFSNREVVREVMTNLDAVYISFKQVPILETGSPNKYFDALAAGKLVITNFGGWIEEEIENANCGFSYDPNQPEALLEKIGPYLKNLSLLDEAGRNAKLLSGKYDKELLLDKLAAQLAEIEIQNPSHDN